MNDEWWNSLTKPEKRVIAILWFSIQLMDDMIKNSTPELKKLMGYV